MTNIKILITVLIIYVVTGNINNAVANETLLFDSSNFNHNKSLVISLPESYHNSPKRHYPVIYLLNAKGFYLGDLAKDTAHTISQLTVQKRLPESILVAINSESWYSDVIVQYEEMSSFLINEVATKIHENYRALPHSILIGHSYVGAFMVKTSAKLARSFNHQLIISPIFPDVAFIQSSVQANQTHKSDASQVQLYVDPENLADVSLLTDRLKASEVHNVIDVTVVPHTGHFSVLPIAITKGFSKIYADFLMTSEQTMPLSYQQLTEKYIAVQHKYQQPKALQDLDGMVTSFASNYLENGFFEQAFALWPRSTTKFKHYFINRAAQRYFARKDYKSAQIVWQGLAKLYPYSPFVWQHLISLAKTIDDAQLKAHAMAGFNKAKSNFTLAEHLMWLAYLEQNKNLDTSVTKEVLRQILRQDPNNQQATTLMQALKI